VHHETVVLADRLCPPGFKRVWPGKVGERVPVVPHLREERNVCSHCTCLAAEGLSFGQIGVLATAAGSHLKQSDLEQTHVFSL
jgi:hypothetical protein